VKAGWRVRRAEAADRAAWSLLREALWPQEDASRHADEIDELLSRPHNAVGFLALDADGIARGFAEATLRGDYVNGTDGSPVGFLEGWYVQPEFQREGVGRALIEAVERWTVQCGCSELASDALLDNLDSHRAHEACGLRETERVVYFRKRLRDNG